LFIDGAISNLAMYALNSLAAPFKSFLSNSLNPTS
jgi:hypothetical protein